MNISIPRLIHASVGPKVLSKAAELFDASLSTVLNEVLQNSRRAGASAIDIRVTPINESCCEITVTDNGSGIEYPEQLLAFGESGWNLSVDISENAAGMGCASLGSRGCTVQSRDWKTILTPDAFVGKEHAAVLSNSPVAGTIITWTERTSATDAKSTVARAARFYPLAVTINGERHEPEDFLANALWTTTFEGIRIGVFPGTFSRLKTHRGITTVHTAAINFYGLTVHKTSLASLTYATSRHGTDLYAVADVVDAPQLRLVLPARHAVIDNDFFKRLQSHAYVSLLEYAATTKELLSFEDFRAAKAAGIAIDVGTIALPTWSPSDTNGEALYCLPTKPAAPISRAVIVADHESPISVDLARAYAAVSDNGPDAPLFCDANNRLTGYPWYDAIPRTTGISYEVRLGDQCISWNPEADEAPTLPTFVDALTIVVKTTSGEIRLDTDLLTTFVDEDDCPTAIDFAVSRTQTPSISTVVSHLMDIGFSYWDEGDSYDTQRGYAESEYTERVTALLLSPRAATLLAIHNIARKLRSDMHGVRSVLTDATNITVTFEDGTVETLS